MASRLIPSGALHAGAPLLLALACSAARVGPSESGAPSLTLPARFAEGSGDGDGGVAEPPGSGQGPVGDAGEGGVPTSARTNPPDPEPITSSIHFDHSLHYARGKVTLERVTRVDLPAPAPSPRRMGRFAIELWIGPELVERVRFDFPLLAADVPEGRKRPLQDAPRFAPGADTRATVRVAQSERATRAVLVDRQTGRTQPLPWPPAPSAALPPAPSADAPTRP